MSSDKDDLRFAIMLRDLLSGKYDPTLEPAVFEAVCVDLATGDTESATGHVHSAGLLIRSESGRHMLIPPNTALEILDSVTAISVATILRTLVASDPQMSDEEAMEKAELAQAMFRTIERMVKTETRLDLALNEDVYEVISDIYESEN